MSGLLIMGIVCLVIALIMVLLSIYISGYYDIRKNEIIDTIDRNGKKYYVHKITYDDDHVKYKKYKV